MATAESEPLPVGSSPEVLSKVGVAGLDDVLGGGLTPCRLYLIEGAPGTGKTTLALQFLREGAAQGERVLYVTLSETEAELRGVAASHGWDLSGIDIHELLLADDVLSLDGQSTLFHSSEVELAEVTRRILEEVDRVAPSRVVFDSMSELRLMAGNSLRYRRHILALKQFFAGRQCTVLLLDDMTAREHELQQQSIAHAVVRLELQNSAYGATRRRLVVIKYRGHAFRDGYHDYKIERGGLQVFPRLVAAEYRPTQAQVSMSSGVVELDRLLGGGLERGTSTLVVGAPGTGKSTLAMQFAIAAAQRGERSAVFIFDESLATLRTRCESMGMSITRFLDNGTIEVRQVDPAELSPGEFVHAIRVAVLEKQAAVLVIDSLNGYLNAMPDEQYLVVQLHELLTFLGQQSVATLLIGAQHGLIGSPIYTPVDASYLADAVVVLRYFELDGEVRQAISVVKKRGAAHERTIRAYAITRSGIQVGQPLRNYRGILSGIPTPLGGDA